MGKAAVKIGRHLRAGLAAPAALEQHLAVSGLDAA
jgi:hypothetical protein